MDLLGLRYLRAVAISRPHPGVPHIAYLNANPERRFRPVSVQFPAIFNNWRRMCQVYNRHGKDCGKLPKIMGIQPFATPAAFDWGVG